MPRTTPLNARVRKYRGLTAEQRARQLGQPIPDMPKEAA